MSIMGQFKLQSVGGPHVDGVIHLTRRESRPADIPITDDNKIKPKQYNTPCSFLLTFDLVIPRMNSLRTTGRSFARYSRIASGLISASVYQHPRFVQSQLFSHRSFTRTMASAVAKRLEGKTVVITGASSGIGYATAKEFARTSPANLKIVVTARRVDRLEQLAKEIKEEVGDGVKVLPVALDVSNPQQVKDFIPSLPAEFQEIDVLVNNA